MKDGIIITILLIVWTVIKLVFKLIWVIVKILAALFLFFGLYIPLFYAVFGIVLLATTNFSLGGMGTDQVLYYIGLGLCGVASIIISIRNLIVRPISAIFAPFLEYRDDIKKEKEKFRKEGEDAQTANNYPPAGQPYPPYYGQGYDGYGRPNYSSQYPADYPPQTGSQYSADYLPQGNAQYPPRYPQQYPYPPRQPYDGRPEAPRAPYLRNGARDPSPNPPYYEGQGGYPPYVENPPSDASDHRMDPPSPGYPTSQDRGRAPAPERPLIYYSKRRPGILVKEYSDRFELYDESDSTRRYIGTEYKDD